MHPNRPRQITSRYLNEDATSAGPVIFTVMEENNTTEAGTPTFGGNVQVGTPRLTVFDVSINDTNKVYHNVRFTLEFACTGNGDCLINFAAPMSFPFVIGTNESNIIHGFANSGTGGDAKCVDVTIVSGGDIATQAMNWAIHECVNGQSYTATVSMAFLN